jgi:hypothetical protein
MKTVKIGDLKNQLSVANDGGGKEQVFNDQEVQPVTPGR